MPTPKPTTPPEPDDHRRPGGGRGGPDRPRRRPAGPPPWSRAVQISLPFPPHEPPPRDPGPVCSVGGCRAPAIARGWCHAHYSRWRRNGDVRPDVPVDRDGPPAPCAVAGCRRSAHARGWCARHYKRWRAHGDPRPQRPIAVQDGTGSISHGYRWVPIPDEDAHLFPGETQALEHRLVVAQELGRPLEPDEVVHHRNGDRLDNRVQNLELWSTSHPMGQRVADKVAHARRILQRYAPRLLTELPEQEA